MSNLYSSEYIHRIGLVSMRKRLWMSILHKNADHVVSLILTVDAIINTIIHPRYKPNTSGP
jgi:hypothetical protein